MESNSQHFFDLQQVAKELPSGADDMLKDIRMVEGATASCRLVRMYRQLPLHFHKTSDENVYVFSGKGLFQLGEELREISAGMFIQFPKGMPHAVLEIYEEPLLTLTVDTPCRPEDDVTFINPGVA